MISRGLLAALLSTLGCSAIVNPEELPILCEKNSACPDGMDCALGVCRPEEVVPEPDAGCTENDTAELCNGVDDNCNGRTDEGHDVDEDGVTWCNGGNAEGRDCNDHDPLQAPGLEERCDGRDNDCDGRIDEDTCPGDGVCDPVKGDCALPDPCDPDPCEEGFACEPQTTAPFYECIQLGDDDCRNEGFECPESQFCDANGRCADLRDLGGPCGEDSECVEGFCADPQMLRMSVDVESFCSRICCTPGDCPTDFVCWQPGGGFSACVLRTLLGLGDGDGAAGTDCGGDADCASGACVALRCVEPCCDRSSCGGAECEVSMTNAGGRDELLTMCGGVGQGGVGDECSDHPDCASGLCVFRDWEPSYCTAPCCTSADCGYGFICTYVETSDLDPVAQMRLCWSDVDFVGFPYYGEGETGEDCNGPGDCRSDYCENGRCVDTCCSQSDCQGGSTCEVRGVTDGGQLLCLP